MILVVLPVVILVIRFAVDIVGIVAVSVAEHAVFVLIVVLQLLCCCC